MSLASTIGTALIWYAVWAALAAAVYPLIYLATPTLPDRGLSLAKPLGLLLAAAGSWWLAAAGALPFTNASILAIAGIVGALSWTIQFRRGDLLRFVAERWRTVLLFEALTVVLFLGYVAFRGFNPDIAYTEKPMDMAFLSSAMRARSMPPPDPWFAGEPINYYYLGYVLMAVPARLASINPGVAFNLALAALFASSVVAAAGTAANILRARSRPRHIQVAAAGGLGALFLVGIGNLVTPLAVLRDPRGTFEATWWQGIGWRASRVIADSGIPGASGPRQTINEFPAFSFILGDLHPHVLALPLFLSTVGIAFGLYLSGGAPSACNSRRSLALLAGTGVGALYAMNAWDMPTALVLCLGAIWLGTRSTGTRAALATAALLVAAMVVTAAPFALNYTPSVGVNIQDVPEAVRDLPVVRFVVRTIGIVIWSRSSAVELLKVHGLFLAIGLALIAALWLVAPKLARPRPSVVAFGLPLSVGIAYIARFPGLILLGGPLAVIIWILRRVHPCRSLGFAGWLFGYGCLLALIPEVFFLQDAFGDRMNTVFKVYFQAWALFAVAGAAALPLALPVVSRRTRPAWAWVAGVAIGIGLLGSALYPPLSAYRWSGGFERWKGLDGLAYIASADSAEADAIDWLASHARPGDVLVEAPGCSYGVSSGIPHDRFSMATGIPTIVGWNFHEYQWRSGQPTALERIEARQRDVNQIYRDPTASLSLLDRYGVTYVVFGALERRGYGADCTVGPPYSDATLEGFDALGWPRVFEQGDVVIFRRPTG